MMLNRKHKLLIVVATIAAVVLLATVPFYPAGPWRGKVIDAGTKQPIEGAVVVAIWYTSHFAGPGGPVERFSDARETLTDKNGNWEIPAYYYNPVLHDKTRPMFIIFKPGYTAMPVNATRPKGAPWEIFLGKGSTVELHVMTDWKERHDSLSYVESFNDAPIGKLPILEKLLLIENKNLGIYTEE